MSGFNDSWLALREPADTRARSRDLESQLLVALSGIPALRLLDLGAGTGSNFRHLAPRLSRPQQWTLVDNDETLLGHLPARLAPWAGRHGAQLVEHAGVITVDAPEFAATIHRQTVDLATDLESLGFDDHDIVTCAALLDLAGDEWLHRLADHCVAARCIGFFVLSYDGRMHWTPEGEEDTEVCDQFNRHQRQDKGLGVSLGPDAADALIGHLHSAGYTVQTAFSDWRLGVESSSLQHQLDVGIAGAVGEIDLAFEPRAKRWLTARQAAIDNGEATLTVGHVDVLALPGGRQSRELKS